jgi:hypothetical protein
LGDGKAAAYRTLRRGKRGDGVVCGRQAGRVEVLTEDYLTVYLSSHAWDGRARLNVTVN